jgi:hypothetical protein
MVTNTNLVTIATNQNISLFMDENIFKNNPTNKMKISIVAT